MLRQSDVLRLVELHRFRVLMIEQLSLFSMEEKKQTGEGQSWNSAGWINDK